MNVLVAEDDAPSRLMLQSLLTRWGYTITTACDGIEAWQILCNAEQPLLVILDWIMPGIEGPEIVRRLRLNESGNQHYVIIITSTSSENAVAQALDAGADDFICKPFKLNELRARIAVGRRVTCLHQTLADKLHKLEAATETITRLASSDELTGLHNRRSFNDLFVLAISAARRHNHPLSLINIDLDNFKAVNDTLGHSVGDRLLQEFAALMMSMVRAEDFAVRLGGDDFFILLPQTTAGAAAVLAERIRAALEQFPKIGNQLAVTACFGVAQLQEGEQGSVLIRRSDEALYRAKHEGRNRVITANWHENT